VEAVDLGVCGDDEQAIEDVLDRAQDRCDAVVTSGGVSVGDLDVVKLVLQKRSAGMRWMQVAIRPAKPFAFGLLDRTGTPVFGLPGNPVSAMVSFELFVRPAGLRMGGHGSLYRPRVTAIADSDLHRRPDGKTHFLRSVASVDEHGAFHVRSLRGQESHQLSAMAEANGLAVLPTAPGSEPVGRWQVMLIDPAPCRTGIAAHEARHDGGAGGDLGPQGPHRAPRCRRPRSHAHHRAARRPVRPGP